MIDKARAKNGRGEGPRVLAASLVTLAMLSVPALSRAQQNNPPAPGIASINSSCLAIHDATMALHPVHIIYRTGTWTVASDADVAVADRTHASVTIADVYKQGGNYAWVVAHTSNSQGSRRAMQLCYRQSDGSLERARQATTVPELDAASAQQAYFAPDGGIISQTAAFEVNDPLLARTVTSLPFYQSLPR